jgi:hypothetical protein
VTPASAEERETGLMAIARVKRALGTDPASKLAAMPALTPEPQERPALHGEGCAYCRHDRCFACELAGKTLVDCRHEGPARHGAGDLTNPPPEAEHDGAVAGEDAAVRGGADAVGGGDGEGDRAPEVRTSEVPPDLPG